VIVAAETSRINSALVRITVTDDSGSVTGGSEAHLVERQTCESARACGWGEQIEQTSARMRENRRIRVGLHD
jgi:hypothetical protein